MKKSIILKFKELMLSIDLEESKVDETKLGNQKTNGIENGKISAIQQKLFEGIEKTKVTLSLLTTKPFLDLQDTQVFYKLKLR